MRINFRLNVMNRVLWLALWIVLFSVVWLPWVVNANVLESDIGALKHSALESMSSPSLDELLEQAEQKKQAQIRQIESWLTMPQPHLPKAQTVAQKPQAFLAVSLSMPDRSLKAYLLQAAAYELPVVIRGLYQNNWQKTWEKIAALVGEDAVGLQIHPQLFRDYQIESVPTLVVIHQDHYDKIRGNVPLGTLFEAITREGAVAHTMDLPGLLRGHE